MRGVRRCRGESLGGHVVGERIIVVSPIEQGPY